LARIALCYLQMGKFNGKQVIPEEWVREATVLQPHSDENGRPGYGYCFWMNGENRGYRLDGMFSQFGIVMPEFDAVIVLTNSEINEEKVRQCVWRHFPFGFIDDCETEPVDACHDMQYPALTDLSEKPRSPLEKKIEGRTIRFPKKRLPNMIGFPVSVLTMTVTYMSADRAGNMDHVIFSFQENSCTMTWEEGSVRNSIVCGMDGNQRRSPMHLGGIDFTAAASASWENEKTLALWVRPLEAVSERRFRFRFKGNKVIMKPVTVPDMKRTFEFLAAGMGRFFKNKLLVKLIKHLVPQLAILLEPNHRGKFVSKK